MSALLAAFLAVSARAGVVAPAEVPVAPSGGTQVRAVPAMPATLGAASSLPGGAGLQGVLPHLPSPVPGLAGIPLVRFAPEAVAPAPEAAPAAAPAAAAPASPSVRPVATAPAAPRAKGPMMPAAPASGRALPGLAVRDGENDGTATSAPEARSGAAGSEAAAQSGRVLFDAAAARGAASVSAPLGRMESSAGGTAAPGTPAPARSGAVSGAGAEYASVPRGVLPAAAPALAGLPADRLPPAEAEELRDAVAAPLAPGVPPGAALPPAALLGARASIPGPAAPRFLSLDLSGAGLVVRVKSLFSPAAELAAAAAAAPVAPPSPAASTAWLERGGLLEAAAVTELAAGVRPHAAPVAGQAAPQAPLPAGAPAALRRVSLPSFGLTPSTAALALGWLLLPLAVLAGRRAFL